MLVEKQRQKYICPVSNCVFFKGGGIEFFMKFLFFIFCYFFCYIYVPFTYPSCCGMLLYFVFVLKNFDELLL
jgi:hypothetical protein